MKSFVQSFLCKLFRCAKPPAHIAFTLKYRGATFEGVTHAMSLLKSGEQLGILAELFDSGGAPAQFDTSEEVSTWTNSNTDAADLIEDPAFPGDFNHRILRFKALGSGSVTLKGDGQQGTGITDVMGSIDYQCVGNDVAIVKLTAGDPTPIPAP